MYKRKKKEGTVKEALQPAAAAPSPYIYTCMHALGASGLHIRRVWTGPECCATSRLDRVTSVQGF